MLVPVMKTLLTAKVAAPWPIKVVIDHVILRLPIGAGQSTYPPFFDPFVQFLDGRTPLEMMMWITLFGVAMVILFGALFLLLEALIFIEAIKTLRRLRPAPR